MAPTPLRIPAGAPERSPTPTPTPTPEPEPEPSEAPMSAPLLPCHEDAPPPPVVPLRPPPLPPLEPGPTVRPASQAPTGPLGIVDPAEPREVAAPPSTMRVEPWPDDVIDALGYEPRSLYVETFWLGILGPSTTLLLRRLAAGFDDAPEGYDLDLAETAGALGLASKQGRHSPFARALARCVTFDLARPRAGGGLLVRRRFPPLPRRHLLRLPPGVQDEHRRWLEVRQRPPAIDETRRRARRMAVGFLALGLGSQDAELEICRWRFHPAVAADAVAWAKASEDANPAAAKAAHAAAAP